MHCVSNVFNLRFGRGSWAVAQNQNHDGILPIKTNVDFFAYTCMHA